MIRKYFDCTDLFIVDRVGGYIEQLSYYSFFKICRRSFFFLPKSDSEALTFRKIITSKDKLFQLLKITLGFSKVKFLIVFIKL